MPIDGSFAVTKRHLSSSEHQRFSMEQREKKLEAMLLRNASTPVKYDQLQHHDTEHSELLANDVQVPDMTQHAESTVTDTLTNPSSQTFSSSTPVTWPTSPPPIGNWQSRLASHFTSRGTVSNYKTHIERLLGKGYCQRTPNELTDAVVRECWDQYKQGPC